MVNIVLVYAKGIYIYFIDVEVRAAHCRTAAIAAIVQIYIYMVLKAK